MKKVVFTLAALLSMTMAFAEGETKTSTNAAAEAAKYEFKINVPALSRTLGLKHSTKKNVTYIATEFSNDMSKAAAAGEADRDQLYKEAVKKNLTDMRTVLSDSQYDEYVKLLNATLANRGLNK